MDDNVKNLQDAMEWLDRSIREEAELEGEMSNAHAIQLGFIQNMLAKFPRRNCDVGTAEGQTARYNKFCYKNKTTERSCGDCPAYSAYAIIKKDCRLAWAQMPYAKGGAK